MGARIYIRNLPIGTSEEAIRNVFDRAGRVADVRILKNRETGRPRGFAFVTMESDREATEAIAIMNSAIIEGRTLRVSRAVDLRATPADSARAAKRGTT